MHSHTSTQPLFREDSVIFQRVERAQQLCYPPVKLYVASLFNLISLKTNGWQQGFLDQWVPGKHRSHYCTHATNADMACTLCRILRCIRDVEGAWHLYMYKLIDLVCTPLTHTDAFTLWWHIDILFNTHTNALSCRATGLLSSICQCYSWGNGDLGHEWWHPQENHPAYLC